MSLASIKSLLPVSEKQIELDRVDEMDRYIYILPMRDLENQFGDFDEFIEKGFVIVGYEDVLGDFVGVDLTSGQLLIVNHETFQTEEKLSLNFEEVMDS